MMRLFAKEIGYLCTTEPFNAVVHSVFDSALNIAKHQPDVPFLCLFDYSLPITPTAIRFEKAQLIETNMVSSEALFKGITAGDEVYCRAGVLRITNRIQRHVLLEVDLRTACVWDQQLSSILSTQPFLCIAYEAKELEARFERFHHLAMQALTARFSQQIRFSEKVAYAKKVSAPMLRQNCLTYQPYQDYLIDQQLIVPQALFSTPLVIVENIGKGKGLTPSGDDLICGILAVLYSAYYANLGLDKQVYALIVELVSAIQQYEHKTTSISRHYLGLAVQGHFSLPVIELLTGIFPLIFGTPINWNRAKNSSAKRREDVPEIEMLLNKLLAIGNQSGADTLIGMLYGFEQLIMLLESKNTH